MFGAGMFEESTRDAVAVVMEKAEDGSLKVAAEEEEEDDVLNPLATAISEFESMMHVVLSCVDIDMAIAGARAWVAATHAEPKPSPAELLRRLGAVLETAFTGAEYAAAKATQQKAAHSTHGAGTRERL